VEEASRSSRSIPRPRSGATGFVDDCLADDNSSQSQSKEGSLRFACLRSFGRNPGAPRSTHRIGTPPPEILNRSQARLWSWTSRPSGWRSIVRRERLRTSDPMRQRKWPRRKSSSSARAWLS
jgi:hypothetical protein